MSLRNNWREILRYAWSSRLMLIAGLLTGAEMVVQAFGVDWMPGPQWLRMLVYFLLIAAAYVARIVSQGRFNNAP